MEGIEPILYVDVGKGNISDFHPRRSLCERKIVVFVGFFCFVG